MANKCFLISGFSGVGKTTIAYEVIKRNPSIERVITSTTRTIRPNEKNGVDYYFYKKTEFEEMLKNNEFFESAIVYDNYYGSEKKEVSRIFNSGRVPLFVCDVQGVINLSRSVDNLVKIFIVPDSMENLRKRIEERDGSTPEDTEKRLKQVKDETKIADFCDYKVINKQEKLDDAVNEVLDIISKELTN
jgi:guanylate kinase